MLNQGLAMGAGFVNGFGGALAQRMQADRLRQQQQDDEAARQKALSQMENTKYEHSTYAPKDAAFLAGLDPSAMPQDMSRMDPSTVEAFIKSRAKSKTSLGSVGSLADKSWLEHLSPDAAASPVNDEATLRYFTAPFGSNSVNGAAGNRKDRLPVTEIEKLSDRQEGSSNLEKLRQSISDNKDVLGPVTGRFLDVRAKVGDTSPDVVRFQKSQGLYNDVRQAIGKAKEGGVLRKEDEIKYEKILGSPYLTFEGANEILGSLQGRYDEDYQRRTGNLQGAGYTIPPVLKGKGSKGSFSVKKTAPAPAAAGTKDFSHLW